LNAGLLKTKPRTQQQIGRSLVREERETDEEMKQKYRMKQNAGERTNETD
jgi:hypothetical protein